MPIPILGVPDGNHMVYMRVRSLRDIHYSTKVIQDFWKKPAGVDKRPNLVKKCPDPENSDKEADAIVRYLKENNSAWASLWGIKGGAKEEPVIDVAKELGDSDVRNKLLKLLQRSITEDNDDGPNNTSTFTQQAIVVFKGEPDTDILKTVQGLNLETIISLEKMSKELPVKVEVPCANRAWQNLEENYSELIEIKKKYNATVNSNESILRASQAKDETIANLQNALDEDEKQIIELCNKQLMKELESRGYVEPKRRPCELCRDSTEHPAFIGDFAELNDVKNVELLCPLLEKGQRCVRCTKSPPDCYGNGKSLECKMVEENLCNLTIMGKDHSTLPRDKRHTRDIHNIDKSTEGPFVKRLKKQYGTWVCPELDSDEEQVEW